MTHEPKGLTEGFVESTKAAYAYAFEPSKQLMSSLRARGFPSAYLVDPSGVVVWEGHPGELRESDVERHLTGALRTPLWEWPKSLSKAKRYLLKGELRKSLEAFDKARGGEEIGEIRSDVVAMIEARLAAMEDALAQGDVLRALKAAEALVDGLGDAPLADRARATIQTIEADEGHQQILELQRKLEKLADVEGLSDRRVSRRREELRDFIREAEGTIVERQAQEVLADL